METHTCMCIVIKEKVYLNVCKSRKLIKKNKTLLQN